MAAVLAELRQEWRQQRRSPFVWFALTAFFLVSMGATAQLGDMVLFTLLLYGGLQLFVGAALIWIYRRR